MRKEGKRRKGSDLESDGEQEEAEEEKEEEEVTVELVTQEKEAGIFPASNQLATPIIRHKVPDQTEEPRDEEAQSASHPPTQYT